MAPRFSYFFRETATGLRRNGLIAFAAVSSVFVSLFLLGAALLVGRQVGIIVDYSTAKVEVSVFLKDSITDPQIKHLDEVLTGIPEVASVEFESRDEAYARFKEIFANQPALVENVPPDAMPQSFRVKLGDPEKFEVVAARLVGQPGIDKVVDQREILKRLFAVTNVLQVGAFAAAVIMLISAAALIGNTVRMAVFARRKEIGIMKLVGATNWFIRWPFVIEGVFVGFMGGVLAVLLLTIAKETLVDPLSDRFALLAAPETIDFKLLVVILLVACVAVSAAGSGLTLRKFLRV